jgi:hypothetical protein
LSEHGSGEVPYFPRELERRLRTLKDASARDIYDGIMADLLAHSAPLDDVSLVVIKLAP